MIFSSDARWLASGCGGTLECLYPFDGTPRLGRAIELSGHEGLVMAAGFTPDRRWLVTASDDRTARLWPLDPSSVGGEARVLRGHAGQLLGLAISPDGRWLATSALDAAPRLWDLAAPDPASTGVALPEHGRRPILSRNGLSLSVSGLYDVAFSPDSRRLATVGMDGVVRVWNLDVGELVELACRVAGRNLTLEEWDESVRPPAPYRCTCPGLPPGTGAPEECPARAAS